MAVEKILSLASHAAISPASIVDAGMDHLEDVFNGVDELVDGSSPYMNLIDFSASSTAMALEKMAPMFRKRYPLLAQTHEDLYHHMSDADHLGRFCKPAATTIVHAIAIEDIKRHAIVDPLSQLARLTIPKDTVFTVGGMDFYMHYPINIVVLRNGDLHTYMDSSIQTPLVAVSRTNLLKSQVIQPGLNPMLAIHIPVEQLYAKQVTTPIVSGRSWTSNIPFKANFYYARVYWSADGISWSEFITTHSTLVYDRTKPTAIIKASDNNVNVFIPEVYQTSGLISGSVRVQVFSSDGDITADLSDYNNDDWSHKYNDWNGVSGAYAKAVGNFSSTLTFSTSVVSGGSDGIDFETLRQIVVYGLHSKPAPITAEEFEAQMLKVGYKLKKDKDRLGNRIYVASRKLPAPGIDTLSTAIGTTNRPVGFNDTRADLPVTLVNNGNRMTIRPTGLYEETNLGTRLLSDDEVATIRALNANNLADLLGSRGLYYTPFHYVIDGSGAFFQTRTYYLADPSTGNGTYVASNSQLGYVVSTQSSTLTLDNNVYKLTVVCKTPKGLTDMHLQLSYITANGARSSITAAGTIISTTETEFVFELHTNLDIDSDNRIMISSLCDSTNTPQDLMLPIDSTFDLFYTAESIDPVDSPFDHQMNWNAFTGPTSGIVHERIDLVFGIHMDGLYNRGRPLLTEAKYKVYSEDVPATHPEDVYFKDARGKVVEVMPDGSLQFKKEFSKGDPITVNGTPVMLHAKGQFIIDPLTNGPILEDNIRIEREVRVCLFDAKYMFANTNDIAAYRGSIPNIINGYISNDIKPRQSILLEDFKLYFEPSGNIGTARVRLDANREVVMRTDLKFKFKILIDEKGFNDNAIREATMKGIRDAIKESISGDTFSVMATYSAIIKFVPTNVVNVDMENPITGSKVAKLMYGDSSWSIATLIRPLSNGNLDIVDAIEFDWSKA